ncbi:MAG: hypothetical protein OXU62_00465 [Gammaproteobacteria bacterium]|nr:hypothetical protein [Gammaproteobacteria bacterium]
MKKAMPEHAPEKTLGQLLSRFNIKLRIKTPVLDVELEYSDADKSAAWELYVEMLTRIVTQPLHRGHGSEQTALESVYSMFPTTREILKKHGPECAVFAKIAVPVLNQVVRPFTAKWHKLSLDDGFSRPDTCKEFRGELDTLRENLINYSRMLAELAGVEDLTDLEEET